MATAQLKLTEDRAILAGKDLPPGICRFDLRRIEAERVTDFVDQPVPTDSDGRATVEWPIEGVPAPSAWLGTIWIGETLLTTVRRVV